VADTEYSASGMPLSTIIYQGGSGAPLRLLVLLLSLAVAAVAQTNSAGHIDGVVVNQLTGEPIKKATVYLHDMNLIYGTNGPSHYSAATDSNGRFTIDQIKPGRYAITADRPGFLPDAYRVSGTSSIPIGPGQSLGSIRLQLTPLGSISGRVLDEDGDPITDVQLQVQQWSVVDGVRRLNGTSHFGDRVDEQGNFRISNVDPGRYVLSASFNHFTRGVFGGNDGGPAYVTTYYPNAVDAGQAVGIPLGPGGDVRGIEIRLRKERMYTVSGKMVDAISGEMVKGLFIGMHPVDNPMGGASSTNNGNFMLRGLPGSYMLVAGRTQSNDPALKGRSFHVPVTIADHDIKDLVVRVEPPATLTGTVLDESGAPVAATTVRGGATFRNRPIIMLTSSDGSRVGQQPNTVKEDGTFEIRELERDRYHINVIPLPADSYVKSMRLGSSEIKGTVLDLVGGGGALQVVISSRSGEIKGMVRNEKGDPLPEITLTITPTSPDSNAQFINTRSDESGQYKIGGLAPGEYRVIGWEDYDYNLLSGPALLAMLDNASVTVKVEESGHAIADATIVTHDAMMAAASKLP
jgi:hypothetical protein